MSWCLNKGIKIYPVTEFEYQHRKLLADLNSGAIGKEKYKQEYEVLFSIYSNKKIVRITIDKPTRISTGELQFHLVLKKKELGREIGFYINKENQKTIEEQIRIIYKMIYDKENKI